MGQSVFVGIKTYAPGMNELASLNPIGNYGVQATWGDGHDTGIYTWDMFRLIFQENLLSESSLVKIDKEFDNQS